MKSLARTIFYRCYLSGPGTHKRIIKEITRELQALVVAAFGAGLVFAGILVLVMRWVVA